MSIESLAVKSRQIPFDQAESVISAAKLAGEGIALSRMFGCQNVGQGFVIALHCLQTDTPLLSYQRQNHLIDGRPSMPADVMLAKFRQAGGKFQWLADGSDGQSAQLKVEFDGNSQVVTYSLSDAQRAGLVKPNGGWVKNPANMLRARVVSNAVRMVCPEVNAGLYTPEEIADFDDLPAPKVEGIDFGQTIEPKRGRGRPRKDQAPTNDEAQQAESTASAPASQATIEIIAIPDAPKPAAPVETLAVPVVASAAAPATPQSVPSQPTPSAPETVQAPAPQPAPPVATSVSTPQPAATPANEIPLEMQQEIQRMYHTLKLNEQPEKWAKVLEMLGCPAGPDGRRKITLGTLQQAKSLVEWMAAQIERLNAMQKTKTLEEWAEGGVPAKA